MLKQNYKSKDHITKFSGKKTFAKRRKFDSVLPEK